MQQFCFSSETLLTENLQFTTALCDVWQFHKTFSVVKKRSHETNSAFKGQNLFQHEWRYIVIFTRNFHS